jgi:anthranilate phosphoribosyltransferase
MLKEVIRKTTERVNLSSTEMEAAMEEIMEGRATSAQIGCLLTALKMKGETVDEITGAARVMRSKAVHVSVADDGTPLVDTCGTGGDRAGTFNISTTVAFILAGGGARVAKHGNRSVSSSCGSADVLMELGAPLDLPPDAVGKCIEQTGFGFLFAPAFHVAMKHAASPRREMGIRTMFNVLGPLTNPASATCHLLGVYDPNLTEVVARALRGLGTRSAMVAHGLDGLDEISLCAATKISRLHDKKVTTFLLDPRDLGMTLCSREQISGGSAAENARHLVDVLEGKPGPRRDVSLLNAAAAFVAAEFAENMEEGLKLAEQSVSSGNAKDKLNAFLGFGKSS